MSPRNGETLSQDDAPERLRGIIPRNGPESKATHEEGSMAEIDARTAVVHRAWHTQAPICVRGEGIYLYDEAGKRYIDGAAGSSVVCNIGHGVESVARAMYEQACRVAYAATHAFTTEAVLTLGPMVVAHAPGTMRDNCRLWLSNTGTDAMDDSARLARQYWVAKGQGSKYIIISRWQGFHGNNLAVAGFSGHTLRRRVYFPMYVNTPHIPPAYCYRCPFEKTYPACDLKCARELETIIHQTGEENIAAFVAEPVVGAALGAVPAPEGYLPRIREICDRNNILFIADEVMTAWGRIGYWFGMDKFGVTPDIIGTAKGIASGYATLAATLAKEEIWRAVEDSGSPFLAGHTMNQNPVAAAAAVANLKYVVEHDLFTNSKEVGAYLLERMQELLSYDIVGDVRGVGLMCGLELVADRDSKAPFDPKLRASAVLEREAMRRGLLLFPCTGCVEGVAGDMMLVTPPLIITRAQVDEMIDIMKESVSATQHWLRKAG